MQEPTVRSWERVSLQEYITISSLQEYTPFAICRVVLSIPGRTTRLQQEVLQGLEEREGVEEERGLLCHAGFCALVEFISGAW